MALRTQAFQVMPWKGGLDLSQRASDISPTDLVTLDNVVIRADGTRTPREGIDAAWDDRSSASDTTGIVQLHDFWFESLGVKDHKLVAVTGSGSIIAYALSGSSTIISNTTSPLGSTNAADIETFTNRAVIVTTPQAGSTSMYIWNGTDAEVTRVQDDPLFNSANQLPPNCSILRPHLNRLWTNDLERPDRLHYSTTNNVFEWQGSGDSGVLDIDPGDGDPDGITAIFPTFRGELFVAKKTKLYRISGTTPETFTVQRVSDGIGCESHQAVAAIDTEDVFWVSNRGVHSLATTDRFGDFQSQFISQKIQNAFNDSIEKELLPLCQARYLPEINSVAFSLAEQGSSTNNVLYWYNVQTQQWFTWSNIDAQAIAKSNDGGVERLYFGRSDGRVSKTQTRVYVDVSAAGVDTSYTMTLKTGRIAPDSTLYTRKGFKKFSLIYDPTDTHSITSVFTIDKFSDQAASYSEDSSFIPLGSSFILGTNILGDDPLTGPFTNTIDGYGRGFQLEVVQTVDREWVEIQGFVVEWEGAETTQEFRTGEATS